MPTIVRFFKWLGRLPSEDTTRFGELIATAVGVVGMAVALVWPGVDLAPVAALIGAGWALLVGFAEWLRRNVWAPASVARLEAEARRNN